VAAALFLALGNAYSGETCPAVSPDSAGVSVCASSSRTLIQENGSWVVALLAIPVLLTGIVFVSVLPRTHWDKYAGRTAAVGLLLFCVVLIVSLGLLFLPALALSTVALVLDRNREPSTA
jgi:hypothetical protein